jgi:hypothetical protein
LDSAADKHSEEQTRGASALVVQAARRIKEVNVDLLFAVRMGKLRRGTVKNSHFLMEPPK